MEENAKKLHFISPNFVIHPQILIFQTPNIGMLFFEGIPALVPPVLVPRPVCFIILCETSWSLTSVEWS